ncbi:hypothetical protein DM02DRAFT_658853 [Periconia macrospinosa]|uniref:Tat pathway signal sequence n=1 Tax=Periconia macrospinosa TaxID=97972 RepID=A0A2V1DGX1_9PLEO|nr:hypothetical protein DM02DRAFT_658853 [Periconia macrospinosa]
MSQISPKNTPRPRNNLSNLFNFLLPLATSFLGFLLGSHFWGTAISDAAVIATNHNGLTNASALLGSSMKPMTFVANETFTGPPSQDSNAAWENLIPPGRGFVRIVNEDSGEEGQYCVSVFHQLHCLDMLRRGYYAATARPPPRPSHALPSAHMQHCFDYIRQALICAADQTLEERDNSVGGVKGWGTTHQCRNFEALKEWTHKHRYSDEGGITN